MSARAILDPKAWAVALVVLMAGIASFLSSPNWALALLITLVCAVLAGQFLLMMKCMAGHAACRDELAQRDKVIAWLYLVAQIAAGNHDFPPLSKFMGARGDELIDEVKGLVRKGDIKPRRR